MSKRLLFIMMILLSALLAGCTLTEKEVDISEYYPLIKDTEYIYEGEGNEFASLKVVASFASDDKIQLHTDNGGTSTIDIYEINDTEIKLIYTKSESYYHFNLLDTASNTSEVILKEPLKVGTTWTLNDGSKRTITSINEKVTTDIGEYTTIKVVKEKDNDITEEYFAKDVGLVKRISKFDTFEVSSTLSEINKNKEVTQVVSFYYPNLDENKYYFKNVNISLKTNEDVIPKLFENYKNTPSNVGTVISNNTKINDVYFKDDIIYVDFNEAFVNEMNAGSLYESMILQSVANTFSQYFNTDKVIITIDDELYESGHVAFKEGEFLTPKLDNIEEIK